jgi:hypothetical protein
MDALFCMYCGERLDDGDRLEGCCYECASILGC